MWNLTLHWNLKFQVSIYIIIADSGSFIKNPVQYKKNKRITISNDTLLIFCCQRMSHP